ncbi:MAG TPA: DNA mismatch repair endonuclease MutL [Clostridia bacterium]|nr:DNA mismatch repair endonuclease MutL [Clostridia bacterium]
MPKINVLPKQIAELIAAGEVVERPASVVKELVENSIDAGATSITVEIKNGGIKYIRITDNGYGISPADIKNAFLSHATSKISNVNDLDSILTLGFRGEALASICAVSNVEVLTRIKKNDTGVIYKILGGEEAAFEEAGCPIGTTIVVRDLFYNTPARMKFLKKDVSEANAVAGVVDRLAISHPEISFSFIRDGKQTLMTQGGCDLKSTIYSVFGKAFSESLVPVDYSLDGVKVKGFVSKPANSRPNRSMQFFFINNRLVKTGTGSVALGEAYKNSVMVGKHPACVLNIDIPPQTVDVNVHPAKIEVRFENEREIFKAIYYAVKNAITGVYSRPKADLSKAAVKQYFDVIDSTSQTKLPSKGKDFWSKQSAEQFRKETDKEISTKDSKAREIPVTKQETINQNKSFRLNDSEKINIRADDDLPSLINDRAKEEPTVQEPVEIEQNDSNAQNEASIDDVIVIGEAFKTYILAQLDQSMLVIDKHAAHERMIFERLRAREKDNSKQLMLTPVTVTLNKDEYSAVLENLDLLSQAGYEVQDFGAGMVIVQECPMELESEDVSQVIMELAGQLLENRQELIPKKLDWIYHSTACRAAIKAGDFTSRYELEHFVKKLLSMPEIKCCPHGRPVIIEMTRKEMEKSFGRV